MHRQSAMIGIVCSRLTAGLVGAAVVATLNGSAAGAGERLRDGSSRIYDRGSGQRIGEIRQRDRYYDVYNRRGERRAYGIERQGVIEFFDAKTSERLPIEIRKDR